MAAKKMSPRQKSRNQRKVENLNPCVRYQRPDLYKKVKSNFIEKELDKIDKEIEDINQGITEKYSRKSKEK